MKKKILKIIWLLFLLFIFACQKDFEEFGSNLHIKYLKNGYKEISDGIGRKLLLVPRNKNYNIKKSQRSHIIQIPVNKVVVYSLYDAAIIKTLGHIDSIKGVAYKPKKWFIPEIEKGIKNGNVLFLGDYTSIDFEKLKKIDPDVVFTWDESIVPTLHNLSIPCVITTSSIAKDLDSHIRFIKFLAAFFNEEKKADIFIKKQFKKISQIEKIVKKDPKKPKVIWGDIYAKKVLVEPGNSWAAQIVEKAGGKYLFSDLQGASCMQVTLEKFFSRIKDADILITYRGPESGITSKEKLKESSTLLQNVNIKPIESGKILFTGERLHQTSDTAGIIEELASILHPKLFPNYKKRRFFFELPEK